VTRVTVNDRQVPPEPAPYVWRWHAMSTRHASPLPMTGYKVELLVGAVWEQS